MGQFIFGDCYPNAVVAVNVALALVDALIALFALYQVSFPPILCQFVWTLFVILDTFVCGFCCFMCFGLLWCLSVTSFCLVGLG